MPRKLHIPHAEFPYHVTARSHGGNWFQLPLVIIWEIMTNYLYFIRHVYGVKIHSFVLMNNHFHLLISTPEGNLSEAMNYFMRETAKEINRRTRMKNQVFGDRHYRSLVKNHFYFSHVYKYIYRNPVSGGIVESCENYRFSTLHGLLGKSPLHIPIEEDTILFENDDPTRTLQWLNTPPAEVNYKIMKAALRRKMLKFPKNRWGEHKHTLEMHVY